MNLHIRASNYLLQLSNEELIKANQVILCTGHMPSTTYTKLQNIAGYFHSAWPIQPYVDTIPRDQKVIIIGSGLTAIDVVLGLVSNGHRGKIIMASRSGRLPAVLGPIKPYDRKYLTLEKLNELSFRGEKPLTLSEVLALFWRELSYAEKKKITFKDIIQQTVDPKIWMQNEITKAKQGSRAWQCLLFSLYSIVPDIWHLLNQEGKGAFLNSNYYSYFMKYLAAFPIENAEKIYNLLARNQLIVFGGLQDIIYDEQHRTFNCKFNNLSLSCHFVVNGTGPGYDVNLMNSSLLSSLLKQQIIVSDEYGRIMTDFVSNKIINAKGKKNDSLFAVGELTRGTYLAVTDLGKVSRQLRNVVYHISVNIEKQKLQKQMTFFKTNYQGSGNFLTGKPLFLRSTL